MTPRAAGTDHIVEELATVARMIEEAARRPPLPLRDRLHDAERRLVEIRDALIAAVRAADVSPLPRRVLPVVNAVVSLVAGVENPVDGVQRSMLEQAVRALRAVHDEHGR
jgi:hypothetical protein